jgi:hypothetical protein
VNSRGKVYWYKFYFAGQPIIESSKSTSKTVAKNAEQQRRRELEAGYNNIKDVRQERVRPLEEVITNYLVGNRLRYRSATFAEYALGHVSRLLGGEMIIDIDDRVVLSYQESRLRENAAPKSIKEEVRFLLKMLGDPGEVIRGRLKKKKQLKLAVGKRIGKAFDSDESDRLSERAKKSRSAHMYLAYEWHVFPWGKPRPSDPTRHVTSLKTAWNKNSNLQDHVSRMIPRRAHQQNPALHPDRPNSLVALNKGVLHFWPFASRVARRDFTSALSQNRT